MAVTFTTIKLNLALKSTDAGISQILETLEGIRSLGSSDVLLIETQFHVTGENADGLILKFRELESLGAIDNFKMNNVINEISSLKEHYLR